MQGRGVLVAGTNLGQLVNWHRSFWKVKQLESLKNQGSAIAPPGSNRQTDPFDVPVAIVLPVSCQYIQALKFRNQGFLLKQLRVSYLHVPHQGVYFFHRFYCFGDSYFFIDCSCPELAVKFLTRFSLRLLPPQQSKRRNSGACDVIFDVILSLL